MPVAIPQRLAATCRKTPGLTAWLDRFPAAVQDLEHRWSLTLGAPFHNVTCAWVAPATLADGTPAVLKLGMPHREGEHELEGLPFWDGDPTVRLLQADRGLSAMLLERCEPGTALRLLPETEFFRSLLAPQPYWIRCVAEAIGSFQFWIAVLLTFSFAAKRTSRSVSIPEPCVAR